MCEFDGKKLSNLGVYIQSLPDFSPQKGDSQLAFMSLRDRILWGRYDLNIENQQMIDLELIIGMLGVALSFLKVELEIIDYDVARQSYGSGKNKHKTLQQSIKLYVENLQRRVDAFNDDIREGNGRAQWMHLFAVVALSQFVVAERVDGKNTDFNFRLAVDKSAVEAFAMAEPTSQHSVRRYQNGVKWELIDNIRIARERTDICKIPDVVVSGDDGSTQLVVYVNRVDPTLLNTSAVYKEQFSTSAGNNAAYFFNNPNALSAISFVGKLL